MGLAKTLTILYTANLRGELAYLPRLYTFLKTLRGEFEGEDARVVLVDLGASCAPEVWHCAVTGGRSTLIVLDGMGYTAANATALSADDFDKLNGTIALKLVTSFQGCSTEEVLFGITPLHEYEDERLFVSLLPADATALHAGTLRLRGVNSREVGVAHLRFSGATPQLHSAEVRVVPGKTPPDATISGVVDFVISEARYLQKRG
jgi:hypothetical protein